MNQSTTPFVLFIAMLSVVFAGEARSADPIAPQITWSNPPDIIKGQRLGGGQLNATANVPGSFVYSPAAGTVLEVGNGQALNTTFTPNDTQTYSTVTAQAFINVLPMPNNITGVNYAVELSAAVSAAPPQITLSWAPDGNATSYTVHRKAFADPQWGPGIPLQAGAGSFTDTDVSDGSAFEYRVVKTAVEASSGYPYTGYGYIFAGLNRPLTDSRGKLILLVDDAFSAPLAAQLARLEDDLIGDGWTVLRHDVPRSAPVAAVKAIITADYNAGPQNVKCVFIFGHLAVPYSGNLNPDGHSEHRGAWPADVYYASIAGIWTDSTVNNTVAVRDANWNVPGDGKFDQSKIPADLELQIGRVDLSNMPAFSKGESDLLAQYLNKDHAFRHKQFSLPARGLVDDNFASLRDQPSVNAWRADSSFFGATNAVASPFVSTLSTQGYLWAFGAGPGDYNSASGIVATSDFAANDMQTVFTMLFGSYFGDWDNANNLLRAPLCTSSYTLTCAWVGRPSWYFHHMALGETIGFSTRLSQNNDGALYQLDNNPYQHDGRGVHMALMGDPTLRLHAIAPPSQLIGRSNLNGVALSWSPSSDSVAGYNIYRAATHAGPYARLNDAPVTAASYLDPVNVSGNYSYVVRAVGLQSTPSGSYWNASQGIFLDLQAVAGALSASAAPNPAAAGQTIAFSAAATDPDGDALNFAWTFGDGATTAGASVTHSYAAAGIYSASVTVDDGHGDSATTSISVVVSSFIGPGPDNNGDGFSDAVEQAAGGPPSDPNSALFGIPPGATPVPLTLSRLAIQLKFSGKNSDSILLTGKLPVPANYLSKGKPVMLILGDVLAVFRLDLKGRAVQPGAAFSVQLKPKGGLSAFSLRLSRGAFAAKLAGFGLTDETIKKAELSIPLTLIFNAQIFQTTRTEIYTARKGRSGSTQEKR